MAVGSEAYLLDDVSFCRVSVSFWHGYLFDFQLFHDWGRVEPHLDLKLSCDSLLVVQ